MSELPESLISDFMTRVSSLSPINQDDRELVERARRTIKTYYQKGFHQLASAARGFSGTTYDALQHDAKIGQNSGCAEFFAISYAELAGDRLHTIVTVRRAPDEEGGNCHVVAPCAMCVDRLLQFSPDVLVIVPHGEDIIKVPVRVLYPLPYAVRKRPELERMGEAGKEWASSQDRE